MLYFYGNQNHRNMKEHFINEIADAMSDTLSFEQMAELKDLKIEIQAYATQEYGFKDCFTAMTTAFPDAFKLN